MKSRNNSNRSTEVIEKTGLHSFRKTRSAPQLPLRLQHFATFITALKDHRQHSYYRPVSSATGREVTVQDQYSGALRQMLMFASNNYLGLANHPYVREAVKRRSINMAWE